MKFAARAAGAALRAFDEKRDADGIKATEAARQSLLAAHAKCAKEAEPNPRESSTDIIRRITGGSMRTG